MHEALYRYLLDSKCTLMHIRYAKSQNKHYFLFLNILNFFLNGNTISKWYVQIKSNEDISKHGYCMFRHRILSGYPIRYASRKIICLQFARKYIFLIAKEKSRTYKRSSTSKEPTSGHYSLLIRVSRRKPTLVARCMVNAIT